MALQQIVDVIQTPLGEPWTGKLTIVFDALRSQPALAGAVPLAGLSLTIPVEDGELDVELEANDAISPEGTYYRVVAVGSAATAGAGWEEYWRVQTAGAPLTLADVRITRPVGPSAIIRIDQLAQGGAADGEVLAWSSSEGAYEPVDPAEAAKDAIGIGALTSILKGDGDGAAAAAVAGVDYAPALPSSGVLKGNGAGGAQAAVPGTDYAPALPTAGLLKGNGAGGAAAAVAGDDYAPPMPAAGVLKGDGDGGAEPATDGEDYVGPLTYARVATYEDALALVTDDKPRLIQVQASSQFNGFTVLYLHDGQGGLWQTPAIKVYQHE